MPILNYISFASNEEFVSWQKAEKRQITSVMPLVFGVSDEGGERVNMKASTGCFVIYRESFEEEV